MQTQFSSSSHEDLIYSPRLPNQQVGDRTRNHRSINRTTELTAS